MKKLLSTTIAVGLFTSMSIAPVFADVAANTLPSLDKAHNTVVTTDKNKMNVQIQGGKGAVGTANWKSFNVGKDAHVNFEFTAHNQTSLNKVDKAGGVSQIYGKITDSGCYGCGYAGSGKVILINPNGVLFGEGASVNVNSLTVSTLDGTFDNDKNILSLTKGADQSDYGIRVKDGANIYGDKNVTFASNNIRLYNGSKISTNTGINVEDEAYGKVKLVTADGVNFEYYNNGAVKDIQKDSIKVSSDKMLLSVNGEIESGHIDMRNYTTNADQELSGLSLKGATLKAVKAVKGNDGNIWLTSANRIVSEDSKYNAGGDIRFLSSGKNSVGTSNLKADGNISIISQNHNAIVGEGSTLTAGKDINITAAKVASAQERSALNAKNINVKGQNAYMSDSTITATDKIDADATNDVWVSNVTLKANEIDLTAGHDVFGDADVQNNLTVVKAGDNIDLKLKNVGNQKKGLVAEAGKNVTIETPGTLSVSRIVSENGNVTLTADKVIAGLPYTDEEKIPGDSSPRSYIYVLNGDFTSKTANDSYEVTASDTPTADEQYMTRHHIEYGNGEEKILLINKRPYTKPEPVPPGPDPVPPGPDPDPVPPGPDPDPDPYYIGDDQTAMLNKIPRQPEVYKVNNNIADGRTTFVDVFAAASQIEIEDDDEQ